MPRHRRNKFVDTLNNAALRGLIGAAKLMPYRWRIPFFWLGIRENHCARGRLA